MIITFNVSFIDLWRDEKLEILIDQKLNKTLKSNSAISHFRTLCGDPEIKDSWQEVKLVLDTKEAPKEIAVAEGFSNIARSWGLSDFKVHYYSCMVNSRQTSDALGLLVCECKPGFFKYQLKAFLQFICLRCPYGCRECSGIESCLKCEDGLEFRDQKCQNKSKLI